MPQPINHQQYNKPLAGEPSSVSKEQIRTDFFKRKALVAAQEELIYGQFADTQNMPRHFGKKIKTYEYIPILNDANLTDQGIDAAGLSTTLKVTIKMVPASSVAFNRSYRNTRITGTLYASGEGTTKAAALTAAKKAAESVLKNIGVLQTDYATTKAALTDWKFEESDAVPNTGNLYGSSRSVGDVNGKMPALSENGGRVNRVGATRKQLESDLHNMGIFQEYSKDSLDFDSDAQLDMHMHRELLRAAAQIQDDFLQINLLNSAGMVRYSGDAVSRATMTGEAGGTVSAIKYEDLMRLDIDMTSTGAPKNIKAITGVNKIDTQTIQSARALLVPSEVIPMLQGMVDTFNRPAFKFLHEYQGGGYKGLRGEIGAIHGFRIIVAPRALYYAGEGADVTNNGGYRETNGKYDVFPMMVISAGAFSEIGFMSDRVGSKWQVLDQKPGIATMNENDPYGKLGRRSLQWWAGSLVKRPEHIAIAYTLATL